VIVWSLWYIIQPMMIKWYGYGNMKKIGWGENLPANILSEWKEWCVSKTYFLKYLESTSQKDRFDNFTVPVMAVYTSDDFIANDKTVHLMQSFFPNSPYQIKKLEVENYTSERVGHIGIFKKKFQNNLWPLLVDIIAN
jgi:predicted alpha/beta hydrolase